MMAFLLLLCILHSSRALPMRFPRKASNSEEGMPYGPYSYPNLQMPHAGSMYGFGLPQYSQMIQLQQALSRQPFLWQPQGTGISHQDKEDAPAQMPRFQLPPPLFPQQPINPVQQPLPNRPQTQPTYQHVTRQPQQPLQLPPVPDSQPPQMFPPFPNSMNPYQQFWQQGNYFPYFGYGARPPYNSEEMNEDEEPAKAEKETPKAESPVTEAPPNATLVEINSTIVDQSQGNSTTQNTSLAGENTQSPNIIYDGQNVYRSGVPMTRVIQGRTINISPGASRTTYHLVRTPNQETISRNSQHNYYTGDQVPLGRGGSSFQNNIRLQNQITGKAPFTNSHYSESTGFTRDTPNIHRDNFPSRTVVPRGNRMGEARGILQDPRLNSPKKEGIEQYNRNIVLKPGDSPNRQGNIPEKELPTMLVNKNTPNQRIIILRPQHNDSPHRSSTLGNNNNNEYFTDYNRHLIIERPNQNFPRGIFTSHQNNAVDHKSNIDNAGVTTVGQNNNVVVKNEGPFMQKEISPHPEDTTYYQNEGRPFDKGSLWNHRQSNTDVGTVNSGQHRETIYLISSIPSDIIPVYSENNPKSSPSHSINSGWDQKTEQDGSKGYTAVRPGETIIYPESELYGEASSMPYSGKRTWNNGIDYITTQYDKPRSQSYDLLGPQKNTQLTPESQNMQDLYITNDRTPLNQKRYVIVSNQDLPKHTERSHFNVNGPLYQNKQPPISSHKVINSVGHNSYYKGFEADSQTLNRNVPYSTNRPFDATESVHYSPGDELYLVENEPIHLQQSPYSEIQSWAYNPDEYPLTQNENLNYDTYPTGMRGQLSIQRETGIDHGGSRHYSCTLPLSEDDPMNPVRGLPSSLLYVCCKLTHVEPENPGNVDYPHDFRITLKEYNEGVPFQDRTHRQHTRNVIDPPKLNNNQKGNTLIPSCNMSATENIISGRETPDAQPCDKKGCDVQNSENPYGGFDVKGIKPCHARGDADNYLALNHEVTSYQKKNVIASEKPELTSINVQEDGSLHGVMENDGRLKQTSGKILRVLKCSQNRQKYIDGLSTNMDKNKPNAFSLKHDNPIGEAAAAADVDELGAENKNDPVNNVPDCLLL